jgi:intracellular multiplication protein IcmT
MKELNPDAHWRDSARTVRFFFVDYRALFPLLLCLFVPRLWSIVLALVAIFFFALLEHYGFSVRVFGRYLRGLLSGPRKVAKPWWLTRSK